MNHLTQYLLWADSEYAPKIYEVWQLSSWIGVAAFTLGDGETNYCELSVVLPLTNSCQGSASPTIDSSWVAAQWVSFIFNCCYFFLATEQGENVKFCFKLNKTLTETYEMLKTVYGDEALSCSSVFERFKWFKDGHEYIWDGPRSGRPSISWNADTITLVREMVTRDHQWALIMMVDE
jgi:hypothetical protein